MRLFRWRRREGEATVDGGQGAGHPNSLFGEILDWMLAPLLFLWPISIIVTHNVADNIANQPYDRALAESVRALSRLVSVEDNQVRVYFPAPPRAIFRADQDDVVYYQVAGPSGDVVSGDRDIPWVAPAANVFPEEVLFRDEVIQGEEVRGNSMVGRAPGIRDNTADWPENQKSVILTKPSTPGN